MRTAGVGNHRAKGVRIGPFTKIPNKLFGSGTAARLGPSASLLFIALCEVANRKSTTTFSVADRTLAADTSLSTRTISEARKRLLEEKLIECTREKGRISHIPAKRADSVYQPGKRTGNWTKTRLNLGQEFSPSVVMRVVKQALVGNS